MENNIYNYDVALSFAGEDREYVEAVAILLKDYGIEVFYDKFEETNLWGKNLFEYLNEVYKNKAKYTVMFISRHYKDKLWTNHERRSMQERAFIESSEYILPVRFDDTEVPGLHSTVAYIDLKEKTPLELANMICSKINWIKKNRWWGEWNVETVIMSYSGTLNIKKVFENGFDFILETSNGAHTGEISGKAIFTSNNEAIFRKKDSRDEEECLLKFFKVNDVIQIDESPECHYYHGMRAYFNGDYKLKKDVFYKYDFINDVILSRLYEILGAELWEEFLKCFGDIHFENNNKNNKTKIIKAAVPGLYAIYEAILIIDINNSFCGAFLDVDKVYIFNSDNTSKDNLLEVIEEWRINFKDKEIIYLESKKT